MHPVANHIIQLQELAFIREEQKVHSIGNHLESLDSSIKDMKNKLPKDVHVLFDKLHKKDHIVMTMVADGGCAACRMKLPISLVQLVRQGRDIHNCPNCARMLYYPETHPRRIGQKTSRMAPRKVGISRFSSHSLVIPKLEATDKEGVIREMSMLMADEGYIDDPAKMIEEVLRREAILSTAVDHGMAFPHVRGVEGGGLTLALGISRKGINWGGSGKGLTRIIFMLAIPTAASAFYLKLLAGLAETFMKTEARKALIAEKDQEQLWKVLAKLTRTTIK